MKLKKTKRIVLTVVVFGVGLLVTILIVQKIRAVNHARKFEAVLLTGHHHMGSNFNISDFYVNGYAGGNVGREGGGGGAVCCVLLPKIWKPGLVAEVRWQVLDWSREHRMSNQKETFDNVEWKNYKALVPIERYKSAEQLYVHFFENGRVRVVSSLSSVNRVGHPIADDDPSAASKATQGILIPELFSKTELSARADKASRRMW